MARYYRRRYTRVVKPKKKWASNLKSVYLDSADTDNPITLSATSGFALPLAVNSLGTASPTPVILKVGNFKCNFDFSVQYSSLASTANTVVLAFIMYLPEGLGLASNQSAQAAFEQYAGIVDKHPEWILAWKQLGSEISQANIQNYERVSFSSRLKRNLNSGDTIALIVLFSDKKATVPYAIRFSATTQFWTCAN